MFEGQPVTKRFVKTELKRSQKHYCMYLDRNLLIKALVSPYKEQ